MKQTLFFMALCISQTLSAAPPAVGETAKDFQLMSLSGAPIRLSDLTAKGPVVLLVLRGFPGYQCPLCNRQVKEFVSHASDFAGATVLMVYPGPAEGLGEKAKEFAADKDLPKGFSMVLDPDYAFTRQYDLRWDAPKETAYPSTFLIDANNRIFFAKVSNSHGGRSSAAEVAAALKTPGGE